MVLCQLEIMPLQSALQLGHLGHLCPSHLGTTWTCLYLIRIQGGQLRLDSFMKRSNKAVTNISRSGDNEPFQAIY